jgi:iron complex outermembrane receptor protein
VARDNEHIMKPTLKHTVLACAITQAFSASAQTQVAPAPSQPIQEVVITGSGWRATHNASVGGFSDSAIIDTPASITSIGRAQMQEFSIHNLTDASKFDASIGDSYNAVGYAEQFTIRGFKLDNNYSYRKDGIAIPADTQIPLENKERIEVLKGLAGLQAGVATPGGLINFVTKRPTNTPLRSVTVAASERGTLLGTIDLGGRFDDRRFGYRINAAAERLRPYVRGADGDRQFVSAAFDWQITPDALLQLDFDHQRKSQVTAPGYQLIGMTALPTGVSAKTLLNDQPWTRPVDTESSNLGLRFEYRFAPDWVASVAANKHWFKRDDFTAFPYGCYRENGENPGFCANGDYDVYDYQSEGERKTPFGAQAMVQGKFATGSLRHALTVGASFSERHDTFGDDVYDPAGTSNIYRNVIVPPASGNPTTVNIFERRSDKERALFAQDIVTLSPKVTLHTGLRYIELKRDQFTRAGFDPARTDDAFLLPNVALVYAVTSDWNVYGSVSRGLEYGGVAPREASNRYIALDPSRSRQVEFGVKGMAGDALSLSAALFEIRKGLEYVNASDVFLRNGEQIHRGLELSAAGKAGTQLNYGLSLMALNAKQQGTGVASMDGKRATNVPKLKTAAWVDYAVPALPALKVNGVWEYAGKKAFDAENRTMVPGYHVFGVGTSYALQAAATKVTLRAGVDNVFDKFYWRDVTPELGGYLIPGAPRTFRVSAQFDF